MGEINNIVCDYLGLPGYYADFWNGTVFRGKRKIKIWQLQRHDREYYKSKYKTGKTGNVRRDVEDMGKDIRNLLKDYRVKIYNLKDLEEENYETSLREIIVIFKRSKDREAIKQYYLEHKERFRQLDEISIDTMGVLIGKKSLKLFRSKMQELQ